MAQRALAIPLRGLAKANSRSTRWVCKRCLTIQSSNTTSPSPPPPTIDPRIENALSKPLAHNIPIQYLQHSTSDALHPDEKLQRDRAEGHKPIVGVVVSAGLMHKTVKVRIPGQQWNKKIGKWFSRPINHLVHDPNSSLLLGDVVELHRLRVSTVVHHVVAKIITPFSTPISERPPVPTPDERLAIYKEKRFAKLRRRELRQKAADGDSAAIQELRSMGLDPGKGVAPAPAKRKMGGLEKGTKINERAQKNKESALKMQAQTEKNLLEAQEVEEELQTESELGAKSILPI